MTDTPIPKVGDTVTTYDQLKALPDGTVLAVDWMSADAGLRFVRHDGGRANLFDGDGTWRNWASTEHPQLRCSYTVKSIPETDPDPEPEWRIGQTVGTYEDLRKLPEGTVVTLGESNRRTVVTLGESNRRTIETRDGVLGAWDKLGRNMLPYLSTDAGPAPFEYTIASLPGATEASDPADELSAFKSQVVEVATRLAKKHALCDVIDDALEELGLPIRNRKHTVTMTVTVQVDLGRIIDLSKWDSERIAEHGRALVDGALEAAGLTGTTVTDATTHERGDES